MNARIPNKGNCFEQIIILYMGPIKGVKKEGNKRRIKHTFVKHITN